MLLPIDHRVQMCRCSFNVHVLVLPRAALGRQHRATMHSLEIPEEKLVPPFGVLGMLRSNAQMPFRVRFDSMRANEFILLLGGWLIFAPRFARPSRPAPISPRSPVPFQTQIPFDSASPPWRTSQKVGPRRPATQRPVSPVCPFDDFRRKKVPCLDPPGGFSPDYCL